MKILHIVHSVDMGGLEKTVLSLTQQQIQDGHDVCIVCLDKLGVLATEFTQVGAIVINLQRQGAFDFVALKAMRKALTKHQPSVVHTHNCIPHYYASLAVFQLDGIRLISTRHNIGYDQVSRLQRVLYRVALSNTAYCVAVCDAARNRFIATNEFSRQKARTIQNGIDIRRFQAVSSSEKHAIKKELALDNAALLLGTIGRLSPIKNHIGMIEAVKQLKQRRPDLNFQLAIVGDGPELEKLQSIISKNQLHTSVKLLGERKDIPRLLVAFDVFLQSSLSEGYSIALLEAAAAGLPIIATDVGGNNEIVAHELGGLLVPSRDSEKLADAIEKLLKKPEALHAYGSFSRHWAEQFASDRVMHQAYLNLYST
jgi:glycosyltransferase involved in cell wall biosynthesis